MAKAQDMAVEQAAEAFEDPVDAAAKAKALKKALKKAKKEKEGKSKKKDKKEKKEKKSKSGSKRKATSDESDDGVEVPEIVAVVPVDAKRRKVDSDEDSMASDPPTPAEPAEAAAAPPTVAEMMAANKVKISGTNPPEPVGDFSVFPGKLQTLLKSQGFTAPTPIQCTAWPVALAGRHVIAVAKTGSGKTLGFGLPAMMHLKSRREITRYGDAPIALIMAPTRELACQIETEANKIGAPCGVRIRAIYGGVPRGEHIRSCREGVDILIATPGRLLDMAEYGQVKLDQVTYVTLDEADRMLDMGFEPDIRKALGKITPGYQMLLFTATWPKKIRALASEFLNDPVTVHIGDVGNNLVASKNVTQVIRVVARSDKDTELHKLMVEINTGPDGCALKEQKKALVFCGTKRHCAKLCKDLYDEGWVADSLHGDKEQWERDATLAKFRRGDVRVLVATDVASRGLDITDISVVINYDFPKAIEDYIHRIGRTGRGSNFGTAYTLFTPEVDLSQAGELKKILDTVNAEVPEALARLAETRKGRAGSNNARWRGAGKGGGRWGRGGGRGGRGGGGGRGGRGRGGFRAQGR